MKSDQTGSATGRTSLAPDGSGSHFVPGGLQAKCEHQALVIDTLSEALSTFERGARALKAENSALRAENERLRRSRVDGGAPAEVAIPIGVQARGVARSAIAQWLVDHVAPAVLETALLLCPSWSATASATVACRKAKTSSCVFTSGAKASGWKSRIPAEVA
jgi:hypothetical protein